MGLFKSKRAPAAVCTHKMRFYKGEETICGESLPCKFGHTDTDAAPRTDLVGKSPVIAVTTDLAEVAGAVVWWKQVGPTNVQAVAAAVLAAGFDEAWIPKACTPARALRLTMRKMRERHLFERSLPGGGWALVAERAALGDAGLEHNTSLSVRQDPDSGALSFEPPGHARAPQIEAVYREMLGESPHSATSRWLTGRTEAVQALSLREGGGIYFVPRPRLEVWRHLTAAVKSCTGHHFAEVPALRSEEAVAAILASLTEEAGARAAELEAEIMGGELSDKALGTRADRCREISTKVAEYEALIGRAAPELSARLEALQASIAAAKLIATPSPEGA